METVIVEISGNYHKFTLPELSSDAGLSVGRAFSNDIIIPDPYVEACQLVIRLASDNPVNHMKDGWIVSNINSTNPVLVNKKAVTTASFNLASGDQLTIGSTNLRFYTETHSIPEVRKFSFTNWAHNQKLKPLYGSMMLVVLFGVMLWMNYLRTSSDIEWGKLAATAILPVAVTLLWASLWSLASRFLKGEQCFFSQLFFTAFCFSLFILAGNVYSYIDYMFSSVIAGEIVDWTLSVLICGLLIGFNFALLSYSRGVFRNGLLASACLFLLIYSLMYLYQNDYDNSPAHTSTIKSAYVPTPSSKNIDGHIEDYGQLFERLSSPD